MSAEKNVSSFHQKAVKLNEGERIKPQVISNSLPYSKQIQTYKEEISDNFASYKE